MEALALLNTDDWVSRFLLGLHSDPLSTPELGEACLFSPLCGSHCPKQMANSTSFNLISLAIRSPTWEFRSLLGAWSSPNVCEAEFFRGALATSRDQGAAVVLNKVAVAFSLSPAFITTTAGYWVLATGHALSWVLLHMFSCLN